MKSLTVIRGRQWHLKVTVPWLDCAPQLCSNGRGQHGCCDAGHHLLPAFMNVVL